MSLDVTAIYVLGERFPVGSRADLLAHPVRPPPPTADMTAAQRAARVREITIAVLAWLADIPDSAIQNDDELQNLVDPVAHQSLSGELARGFRLTKGEEAALYGGLVNDKWDTVADMASYLIKVVEKHFGSRSGRSA